MTDTDTSSAPARRYCASTPDGKMRHGLTLDELMDGDSPRSTALRVVACAEHGTN